MLLQASRVGDVFLNTAEVIFETHTEPTLPTEQMRAPGALELGRLLDSQSTSLISLIASHPKKTNAHRSENDSRSKTAEQQRLVDSRRELLCPVGGTNVQAECSAGVNARRPLASSLAYSGDRHHQSNDRHGQEVFRQHHHRHQNAELETQEHNDGK
jgi:hypothetical protein